MQGGQDRDIWGKLEEFCKNPLLIAVYPLTIELEPEPGKTVVNIISNLKQFIDDLAKSFRSVLGGGKEAVLVRIAHVGATIRNYIIVDNQPIIGKCGDDYNCLFVPIPGDVSTCLLYLVKNEPRRLHIQKGQQKEPIKLPIDLHADPLIYALKEEGGEAKPILSLTYGEDDAEPKHIWYKFVKDKGWSTNNIDAYVLFNSSFIVQDSIDIQLIHGGFKAVIWNPLGCFKASTPPDYCLQFPQVDEHLRSRILERVHVNPHWIRGDYENENVDKNEYILMIVGDDKSSWFFSLPIAPPPLYFLAQRKEDKINLSRNMIRSRLGRDEDEVRRRVSEVLEKYELNNIPSDMRQLLDRFIVKNYYCGTDLGFIGMFRNKVEETMERNHNEFYGRCLEECSKEYGDREDIRECAKDCVTLHIVPDLMLQFHATPQYRPTYRGGCIIRYGNYSYLDFVVSKKWYEECIKNTSGEERYRCSIAWVFGLSLLVLLDSYIEFVEGSKH